MPSSLIIVALAAAWLVVLVPMVVRRRQEVVRPADSALSARVVRSGSTRYQRREEFAMAENTGNTASGRETLDATAGPEPFDDVGPDYPDGYEDEVDEDVGVYEDDYDDVYEDVYEDPDVGYDEAPADFEDDPEYADPADSEEPEFDIADDREAGDGSRPRRYRPGRGGFDPEAAEIAARAKYTYRQRVVVALLSTALLTAILAVAVFPVLWWIHATTDLLLIGYLVYLRRQVRIEDEIRQRRLSRLDRTNRTPGRGAPEYAQGPAEPEQYPDDRDVEYPDVDDSATIESRVRSRPRPAPRRAPEPIQHDGVYVDIEDEDPAFHNLDEPEDPPYRRVVGQ